MVKPKLLDQVREAVRVRHLSYRTEQAYVDWIRRFILFHKKRHPNEMDETYISEFLTFLAVKRNVAASTQNQALSAILFLYRHVLKKELGWVDNVERAKKPSRLPVVFTKDEARAILVRLEGAKWLMASLLYGAGLRLMECLRLRVKDVDFGNRSRGPFVSRRVHGDTDFFSRFPETGNLLKLPSRSRGKSLSFKNCLADQLQ